MIQPNIGSSPYWFLPLQSKPKPYYQDECFTYTEVVLNSWYNSYHRILSIYVLTLNLVQPNLMIQPYIRFLPF